MTERPIYKRLAYTLSAGEMVSINRTCRQVTCLAASEPFRVQFDDGSETDFESGLAFRNDAGFQKVTLRNPTAGPITVAVGLSNGDVTDARLVLAGGIATEVQNTVTTRPQVPDAFTAPAPVNCSNGVSTQVLAADALRKEAILTNTATSGTVYVQPFATSAGRGVPIAAGQTLVLTTSAALYVRNDTGAAVTVNLGGVGWSA